MSLTDKTDKTQTEAITLDFELPHVPQKVWRALTEPDLLAEWLLPVAGLHLAPGTAFTFKRPPMPGWDGVVHCRVLDVQPHHKLSYAWAVGDMDTVVTFTLTPTATGTHMRLVQSGFKPEEKRNFAGALYGWKAMGGKLMALLDSQP